MLDYVCIINFFIIIIIIIIIIIPKFHSRLCCMPMLHVRLLCVNKNFARVVNG